MDIFLLLIVVMVIATVVSAASRRGRPQIDGFENYTALPMAPQDQRMGLAGPQNLFGAPYQQDYPMPPATRQALDSDITTFGDELRDLDLDVVGRELSTDATDDYTRALDAYDGAKNQLARAQMSSDVKRITQILDDGRYAIASVKARVNGQPLPERRPPCFFDPAHGPSVENVQWAPPGGSARSVPACAADLSRINTGNDPSIRLVPMGAQQAPTGRTASTRPGCRAITGATGWTQPSGRSRTGR